MLYWNGDTAGWSSTEHWRVVSVALGLAIATPLFQAARDAGAFRVPYARVHDHVWMNAALWCACWAFVGISALLLTLLGALFGLIGYGFIKLGCEPAPLLLGLILGPMMEEYLRRALLISRGDWSVFVTRPLSASLLVVAAILLIVVLMPSVKKKREEAFVED